MKAYRFTQWQTKPELRNVPTPEPGPGDVLLKIAGSGVCHSDLHVMEWPEGVNDWDIPFTFGHENAGWVEAVGAGVEGMEIGQAVENGADDAVAGGADAEAAIRDITRGSGAELVLDFVGADGTMALGAKVAGMRSHLTIVGLAMGTLPFDFRAVPWECSIAATYWGALPELAEVIALAQAGKVRSRVEYFPLEKADEAYELMRAGALEGRAVITPSG